MRQTITEDNYFDEQKALTVIEIGTIPEVINYFKTTAAETEEKRITALSWLYTFQKRIPLVIGEILLDWERKIKKNYEQTKKYQEERGLTEDLPEKNLFDWFRKNPDRLPFGYSQAKNYIFYRVDREQTLLEAPEKLEKDVPLMHNNIIRQIKDETVREKIREKIAEEGLTAQATKQIVEKANEQIEKKVIITKAKKKININVILKGNDVVIQCPDATVKQYANQWILDRLDGLKEWIAQKVR